MEDIIQGVSGRIQQQSSLSASSLSAYCLQRKQKEITKSPRVGLGIITPSVQWQGDLKPWEMMTAGAWGDRRRLTRPEGESEGLGSVEEKMPEKPRKRRLGLGSPLPCCQMSQLTHHSAPQQPQGQDRGSVLCAEAWVQDVQSVHHCITLTKRPINSWRKEGFILSAAAHCGGTDMVGGSEMTVHIVSPVWAQLAFFSLLGSQPMGWCHLHSR